MRILGSALILLCASIVVVHANANEADEPDIRRGQFDITFTPAQLLDAETLASVAEFVDADEEITWKMHVPESYDPTKPAGLMVYISPSDKGYMPRGWQPVWDQSRPTLFEQVETNRYVFLSGSNDFNLDLTKKIYRSYKGAGLSRIKLIVVPRMAHSNPNTKYFRQAVNFLDERE